MNLFLLTGIPGTDKGRTANKIKNYLEEKGLSVGVADTEDELVELYHTDGGRERVMERSLCSLIGGKCAKEISEKWKQAYQNAVIKAGKDDPKISIVIMRLEYYKRETYEFYSPTDFEVIRNSKPKSVLTIIDDIYDIYLRLSRDGGVFDEKNIGYQVPYRSGDRTNLKNNYKIAFKYVLKNLIKILTWRWKEIDIGERLARALNIGFNVIATKHPLSHGVFLLLGDSAKEFLEEFYPIYVSHPITRPRTENIETGVWPEFVRDLDKAVCRINNGGKRIKIVAVMPTAIDEYRIYSEQNQHYPILSTRWPFDDKNSMWTIPDSSKSYDEYEKQEISKIFNPPIQRDGKRLSDLVKDSELAGMIKMNAEISGMLEAFLDVIEIQMAGRDHLLVKQCPGFFLYRPLHDKHMFSQGVQMETVTFDNHRTWVSKMKVSNLKKIAFVHDYNEAIKIIEKSNELKDAFGLSIYNCAQSKISQEYPGYQMGGQLPGVLVENFFKDFKFSNESLIGDIYDRFFPKRADNPIGQLIGFPKEVFVEDFKRVAKEGRAKTLSVGTVPGNGLFLNEDGQIEFVGENDGNETSKGIVCIVKNLDTEKNRNDIIDKIGDYFIGKE